MTVLENAFPPVVLTTSDLPSLPPLTLTWLAREPARSDGSRPDALLSIRYGQTTRMFMAEYKPKWDARTLETAIRQASRYAETNAGSSSLVVLPYLNEEHLNALLVAEVSGLDLCGNALIIAQGGEAQPDWFLRFTGQPNRFRLSTGLTEPYQGKAALVARTLLTAPVFATAAALQAEIRRRGGQVSQPVVSRALRAFQDDLVVSSGQGERIAVVQPEKLLDRLVEGWQVSLGRASTREPRLLWRGQVNLPAAEVLSILAARAAGQPFTATGLMSAATWTNLSSGETQMVYVDAVGDLLRGLEAQETRRFPNLELWRPPDQAAYFDTVTRADGSVWASPLQTYLELATGDARTQQAAPALRQTLLEALEQRKTVLVENQA